MIKSQKIKNLNQIKENISTKYIAIKNHLIYNIIYSIIYKIYFSITN